MKNINLPPYAPTLMESTRAIGYSLDAAVADIIDNSITALAANVWISFFPVGDEYIAILDDGNGMDEEQLNVAMQYGSKNPTEYRDANDLGRFGLGLKTASLSQCKILTVLTKRNDHIYARQWNLDYVATTGEWSLCILGYEDIEQMPLVEQLKKLKSGTLVVWQNLDRLKLGETSFDTIMGKKMEGVRTHLSLVYHRYLSGESGLKKLIIHVNNFKIEPSDPFLIGKSTQAMDDEVIKIRGQRVVIRPYILPHISKLSRNEIDMLGGKEGLRKEQGFYVYRNKRLLIWGTWFRMMRQGELSKLARIQVDIPNVLDDLWTLDIKKSSAIPPPEIKRNLSSVIDRIAERSKRTWTYRGKKEIGDSIQHVWGRFRGTNGGVYYEINRDHPLVDKIVNVHPELKSSLEILLKQIEQRIPLNQLYVDLNSDEHIDNDADVSWDDVELILRQMMTAMHNPLERKEFLLRMQSVEPFNVFPELIKRLISEGE